MESDFHVEVKDEWSKQVDHDIQRTVKEVVMFFADKLDLRRMHRVIIAMDYASELASLSKEIGRTITYTDKESCLGVAQAQILLREGDFELLPIFNGRYIVESLRKENSDSEKVLCMLHTLHHELCHVHDDNKRIDALTSIMPLYFYLGRYPQRPLAEACWSEYIATFLSSSTATESFLSGRAKGFIKRIEQTKPEIDREIEQFLCVHRDIRNLMSAFNQHGTQLIYEAAHMIAYMEGSQKTLLELAPNVAERLSGSYFEPVWNSMSKCLAEMRHLYPDNWEDLSIYDDLSAVMDKYYAVMRLVFSTNNNGRTSVEIW